MKKRQAIEDNIASNQANETVVRPAPAETADHDPDSRARCTPMVWYRHVEANMGKPVFYWVDYNYPGEVYWGRSVDSMYGHDCQGAHTHAITVQEAYDILEAGYESLVEAPSWWLEDWLEEKIMRGIK